MLKWFNDTVAGLRGARVQSGARFARRSLLRAVTVGCALIVASLAVLNSVDRFVARCGAITLFGYVGSGCGLVPNAEIANVTRPRAVVSHVSFMSVDVRSVFLTASHFNDVGVLGLKIRNSDFSGSQIANTRVQDCRIENCRIAGSSLSGVKFIATVFRNCNFDHCTLDDKTTFKDCICDGSTVWFTGRAGGTMPTGVRIGSERDLLDTWTGADDPGIRK